MRAHAATVLSGIALTVLFEIAIGPLHVADRVLHPGLFAYVGMLLVAFPALRRFASPRWRSWWLFLSAVAVADLIPMAARASGVPPALVHSLLGAALALVVLLPLLLARVPGKERPRRGLSRGVLAVWIVSLATAGAFQAFNRYARASGVSNEERSLLILGIEVHHLNVGVVLLALLIALGGSTAWSSPGHAAGVVLLGVAIGMITDQWYYYAGRSVTDATYFDPATWISWALLSLVLLPVWMLSQPANGQARGGSSERRARRRP